MISKWDFHFNSVAELCIITSRYCIYFSLQDSIELLHSAKIPACRTPSTCISSSVLYSAGLSHHYITYSDEEWNITYVAIIGPLNLPMPPTNAKIPCINPWNYQVAFTANFKCMSSIGPWTDIVNMILGVRCFLLRRIWLELLRKSILKALIFYHEEKRRCFWLKLPKASTNYNTA